MMAWLLYILAALIFLFGFVVVVGPPYVPTLRRQIDAALDLLDLKPGQTLIELGSGDGRVLKAAAIRGLIVVGYELNPVLVFISRLTTWRYRKQVRVVWGNYWTKPWPPAEGIFTFMLARQMKRLDLKIAALPQRPLRFASFAFQIPGRKPVTKKNGVYLYEYR